MNLSNNSFCSGLYFFGVAIIVLSLSGETYGDCLDIARTGVRIFSNFNICEMTDQKQSSREKAGIGIEQCRQYRNDTNIRAEYVWKNGVRVKGWEQDGDGGKTEFILHGDKAEGKATTYYADGTVRCAISYEDNRANGIVKQFYPNGKLKYAYWFNKGEPEEAPRLWFWEDGNLHSLTCAEQSLIPEDRQWCGFTKSPAVVKLYQSDGKLYAEVTHQRSKLVEVKSSYTLGEKFQRSYPDPGNEKVYHERTFHANGRIHKEFDMRNKKKHGASVEYSEDGRKIREIRFTEGKPEEEKAYYLNGKLRLHIVRGDGKQQVGVREFWDNGIPRQEGIYDHSRWSDDEWSYDKPIGAIIEYYEDGSVALNETYKNGKLDGLAVIYGKKGGRIERAYTDGRLTGEKHYGPSGKLEMEEEYYEDGSRREIKKSGF